MFGVPVDSETIRNINPAQWIWYAMMVNKDHEKSFEHEMNMTEYHASFWNGEGVKQVRDARENTKVVSDEQFEQGLRDMFGRDLSPEAIERASMVPDVEEAAPVKKTQPKKKGSISIKDIEKYTGMSLDKIKFHPNKKR